MTYDDGFTDNETDVEDDGALVVRPSTAAREKARAEFLAESEEEVDEFGFYASPGKAAPAQGSQKAIENHRSKELKWVGAMSAFTPATVKKSKKIRQLARSGVPNSVRGRVYAFLADIEKYRKPGLYHELCSRNRLEVYDEIEKDLHRCFPDHSHFKPNSPGREDLASVLKAYAHYDLEEGDGDIGYCQGLDMIAGALLLQTDAENAFWILVCITRDYMKGYHTRSMTGFQVDGIVFEQILEANDKKLSEKLVQNEVTYHMYLSNWVLPLFTRTLPWSSLLRVLDVFLFEGPKFLFRVVLAIFDLVRDQIMDPSIASQSDIIDILIHIPKEQLLPELLLPAAFLTKINKALLRKLTKKAEVLVREGGLGKSLSSKKDRKKK
ncbi:RabGAP/TBC [Atractiella rhizophila]|nr:RabGAP/TBC [Atractiella rhizophila]